MLAPPNGGASIELSSLAPPPLSLWLWGSHQPLSESDGDRLRSTSLLSQRLLPANSNGNALPAPPPPASQAYGGGAQSIAGRSSPIGALSA